MTTWDNPSHGEWCWRIYRRGLGIAGHRTAHRSKHQWHGRDRLPVQALKLVWLADAFAIPVGMGAFYHRLRRNPNRPVGGLALLEGS